MVTVADLKKAAKLIGITGYSTMKKDQLMKELHLQVPTGWEAMTVAELKEEAKRAKIRVTGFPKAKIIQALREAETVQFFRLNR
jgi:hypothetical protein